MTKACRRCGSELPWDREHFVWRGDRQRLVRRCRQCDRHRSETQYDANALARRKLARDRKRIAKLKAAPHPPGLTCDLCSGPFDRACWDHNHATGQFRGWLCSRCNVGLGMLGDNPDLLAAAIVYLHSRGAARTR